MQARREGPAVNLRELVDALQLVQRQARHVMAGVASYGLVVHEHALVSVENQHPVGQAIDDRVQARAGALDLCGKCSIPLVCTSNKDRDRPVFPV